jgi:hypothetical protein
MGFDSASLQLSAVVSDSSLTSVSGIDFGFMSFQPLCNPCLAPCGSVFAQMDRRFFRADIRLKLCRLPQEGTNGTKGWSIAFAFAASRFAVIEKSAIQNFFSSNSSTVPTVEMMLTSSMCNTPSVEIRGQNFERNSRDTNFSFVGRLPMPLP